jgi:hypothetical protein
MKEPPVLPPSIFVVGTQRSGTTLLCRMLTAHPDIFIKNEMPDTRRIFTDAATPDHIVGEIDREIAKAYGQGIAAFVAKLNKRTWGLKDPSLTYCLPAIGRHFPDAKVVFIVRDGRAVANSYIRTKWGSATNTYHGALRWKREVDLQAAFQSSYPTRCHLVRYEDLVRDTRAELVKICEFLEQPYSDRMEHYANEPAFLKRNALNEHTFRDVDEALASKWRTELSARQIGVFEAVAGETLASYSYELVGPQVALSTWDRIWYGVQEKVLGTLQLRAQLRRGSKAGARSAQQKE